MSTLSINALTVVLFPANCLVPDLKPQVSQELPNTMREVASQARRLEAANLTGLNPGRAEAHASAVSFTHVPNRSAIAQQFSAVDRRTAPVSDSGGSSSSGSGSGASSHSGSGGGGGNGGGNGNNRGNSSSRPRPRCEYPKCHKPLGHTTERCFQKKRDRSKQQYFRKNVQNVLPGSKIYGQTSRQDRLVEP